MFRDRSVPWQTSLDLILFFSPVILMSMFIAVALSSVSLYGALTKKDLESTKAFTAQVGFIFSFCVVGLVVGMIIRLLGGFSLGSSAGETPGTFQFVATMISLFAAIAGLFFGESKMLGSSPVRPIGTGSAIFMMMFGYLYLAQVLAAAKS